MKNGYEFSYVLKEQNKVMTFEVLSQPEKWRHNFLWYSPDGIRVDSYDHPAIYTNDSIFLRGRNKELDNFVDSADIQKENLRCIVTPCVACNLWAKREILKEL